MGMLRGTDVQCKVGRSEVELCVPPQRMLCRTCDADIDCGGLENLCLEQNDGDFCATICAGAEDCPEEYSCDPVTSSSGKETPNAVSSCVAGGQCLFVTRNRGLCDLDRCQELHTGGTTGGGASGNPGPFGETIEFRTLGL
jgi:hypothetical protein